MEINLVYRNEFIELVTPIIENEKVKRMDKYIQHGRIMFSAIFKLIFYILAYFLNIIWNFGY